MLHVVFVEDGIPGWIGPEPRKGSEAVDKDLMFLAAHRRTAKGAWVKRPVVVADVASDAEVEAAAAADRAGALALRDVVLREALAAEADPLFFKWQRDECRKEDWLDAVADIKTRYPKP